MKNKEVRQINQQNFNNKFKNTMKYKKKNP